MKIWTWEEINRLYNQEERPTDPEEVRMWKIVRYPIHYGASKETIQKWLDGEK